MLFAQGSGTLLAMAADLPFLASSVGFVGFSDGWQLLSRHFRLTEQYDTATDGNVALTGELATGADGLAHLALGFGLTAAEAAFHARKSLQSPFETILNDYAAGWRAWQASLRSMERRARGHNMYRVSTAILHSHEAPTFPGGVIASLSIPWGFSKSDDDLGGYHLVWPRDLCETAGALMACGAETAVRRILRYLRATQEADGSWPQNCWLDGSPYWGGVQLDECAFPMLLLDLAWREGALRRPELPAYWPMVKSAAGFVMRNGPRTKQDRWEENAGYTPFTIAVAIAALLGAAEMAEALDIDDLPALFRDTADAWNEQIEDWVYVKDGPLAARGWRRGLLYPHCAGIARRPQGPDLHGPVQVRNHEVRNGARVRRRAGRDRCAGAGALRTARAGRSAHPRHGQGHRQAAARSTCRQGPGWRRYNLDGYGEHADGRPFDGVGIGRVWPLLAGERAHYALAAGRRAEAESLLATIEAQTSPGGLIPEQVWDGPPIPSRWLAPGEPSGSAMPLVWAHAEYVKLLRSLADGAVFDMPPHTVRRYVRGKQQARCRPWRLDCPVAGLPAGRVLRVDLLQASIVRYTRDGWRTQAEILTRDTGVGLFVAEISTQEMTAGERVVFTWRDARTGVWHGRNHDVAITA